MDVPTAFSAASYTGLRPILKWAGGKRWLLPVFREYADLYAHRTYVEPFCGSLAIALGLRPERAILNDVNPHVINLYRWIQRGLRVELDMQNDSAVYYQYRGEFNQLIADGRHTSQRSAELFYYLNRTGYNGLCRFNRSGQYNVPFGKYRTIAYGRDFTPYREPLGRWIFTHGDFADIPLAAGDFIYADPPYDVEFTGYSKEGFHWGDQVRLAHWLAEHDGPVIASNQATERVLDLYSSLDFDIRILDAPRRISCNGDRASVKEMLALRTG